MNRFRRRVGVCRNDRASSNRRIITACLAVLFPKTGKCHRFRICLLDQEWLFAIRRFRPFVVAVGNDQATTLGECFFERGFRIDRFTTERDCYDCVTSGNVASVTSNIDPQRSTRRSPATSTPRRTPATSVVNGRKTTDSVLLNELQHGACC